MSALPGDGLAPFDRAPPPSHGEGRHGEGRHGEGPEGTALDAAADAAAAAAFHAPAMGRRPLHLDQSRWHEPDLNLGLLTQKLMAVDTCARAKAEELDEGQDGHDLDASLASLDASFDDDPSSPRRCPQRSPLFVRSTRPTDASPVPFTLARTDSTDGGSGQEVFADCPDNVAQSPASPPGEDGPHSHDIMSPDFHSPLPGITPPPRRLVDGDPAVREPLKAEPLKAEPLKAAPVGPLPRARSQAEIVARFVADRAALLQRAANRKVRLVAPQSLVDARGGTDLGRGSGSGGATDLGRGSGGGGGTDLWSGSGSAERPEGPDDPNRLAGPSSPDRTVSSPVGDAVDHGDGGVDQSGQTEGEGAEISDRHGLATPTFDAPAGDVEVVEDSFDSCGESEPSRDSPPRSEAEVGMPKKPLFADGDDGDEDGDEDGGAQSRSVQLERLPIMTTDIINQRKALLSSMSPNDENYSKVRPFCLMSNEPLATFLSGSESDALFSPPSRHRCK